MTRFAKLIQFGKIQNVGHPELSKEIVSQEKDFIFQFHIYFSASIYIYIYIYINIILYIVYIIHIYMNKKPECLSVAE